MDTIGEVQLATSVLEWINAAGILLQRRLQKGGDSISGVREFEHLTKRLNHFTRILIKQSPNTGQENNLVVIAIEAEKLTVKLLDLLSKLQTGSHFQIQVKSLTSQKKLENLMKQLYTLSKRL
jgi:hypothetical protein